MTEHKSPKENAESAAWSLLTNVVGKHWLVTVLTGAILLGWAFDLGGKTVKGWHVLSELFAERTSVLSGAEIDVANEWVIHIDSGSEFIQVESHRASLLATVKDIRVSSDPWAHFVRNLRVVRDPSQIGNWLLVADVTSSHSSKEETDATILCISSKVKDWFEMDTFGSSFGAAYSFPYRLSKFTESYGRPTNINFVAHKKEINLDNAGINSCPYPYK